MTARPGEPDPSRVEPADVEPADVEPPVDVEQAVEAGRAAQQAQEAQQAAEAAGAAAAAAITLPPERTDSSGERTDDDQVTSRFGVPGMPVNRGHPFYVGFVGATGVLTAYWLLGMLGQLSSVLTLLIVALFLALGLEPVVASLERQGMARGAAVAVVFAGVIALFIGFVSAVVPTLVTQGTELTKAAPDLVNSFTNSSLVRSLDQKYGLISSVTAQIQPRLANGQTVVQLFGGVFGAGAAVISGAFSAFTVLVLTLYFTASLRSMKETAYRLVPASRRPRVRLLADEIMRRIGGYIAGQVAVASINGVFTFIGLTVLGLPYAAVLAITVALFGLIPLVGASLGAVIVVLVGLFHSWQDAVIILIYYVIYQQVENYAIAPRIMARTVSVPGAVAVVAALAGGALLGVVGALIAIPVAAGILLIVQEVFLPRQADH
ncbi:MAG TPA: AI-2E family transporter [Kineosporiaceae bacterium]|nr:AI-2E family transporter [Kineosporiaceae bacterium]